MKKVISIILNILLVLAVFLLIIFLYNYIQTKLLHKDYSNIFGYTAFKVVTGSMSDTIETGDIVFVKIKKDNDEFNKNDIITFKEGNSIITHRIVEIDQEKVITKGDANNTEDQPITREKILGKVVKIVHNVEIWKKVFTSPQVVVSIITTIILFSIAFSYDGNQKNKLKIDKEDSSEEKEDNQ